ncbi:MAG: DEAD/DEAH box helicase family protein [Clostridiales Family XIII bacterium]|jgi:type I site-specific restriction endonuclease|nr:DEAD/DEAH box helicase family protein [Clostridiales Family XIII bacterium]
MTNFDFLQSEALLPTEAEDTISKDEFDNLKAEMDDKDEERQRLFDNLKYMPNLSSCNLCKRGEDKPTDRAIFSTYPTIMNAINEEKTADGEKLFTPAHFDPIIIDEAHRSIFKKYRAIFDYFDALLVGLTAILKDDVSHNTYEFFGLENNMPIYAYEYAKAVSDKYLTDYHCIEKLFRIPVEGIHYDELSPEQQSMFEDTFDEDEEIPDFVSGEAINSQYFNIPTNRVLSKTKLWQMFGRGTRLCEDLFGPGEHKDQFYVFDYLGNFEFFRQDPKGKESDEVINVTDSVLLERDGVSLGRFVRSIAGLSQEAALTAFSEFLDNRLFTEEQITFVRYIIDWITCRGTLIPEDMKDEEFAGGAYIVEVFNNNLEAFQRIKGAITRVNNNAMKMAA